MFWFPIVGWAIGAVTGSLALAIANRSSGLVGASVAVTVAVVLTGALHIDGLADTADALAARTREQALEIMRDSRIGVYGAVAVGLALILRVGTIARMADASHWLDVAAAAALARAAPVVLAGWLGYARLSGGVGELLAALRPRLQAGLVVLIACVLSVASARAWGAAAAMCAIVIWFAWILFLRRWLGGLTGDTAGAAIEITELAVLVLLSLR